MPTPRRKPTAKKKPAAKKKYSEQLARAGAAKKPVTDGLPLLAPGSAHPVVIECARKLETAGHGSSPSSRGESATGVLGPEELGQFDAFRAAHGIPARVRPSDSHGEPPASTTDVYVTPELIAAVLAS